MWQNADERKLLNGMSSYSALVLHNHLLDTLGAIILRTADITQKISDLL